MEKPMTRFLSTIALALVAIGAAQAQVVERVVGLDISNSRAQLAAMDRLFASDVMSGQKATLWASEFDGSAPNNHTLVVQHDSYEDLQSRGARVFSSAEWMAFQQAADGTSEVTNNLMAVERLRDGSGWANHGALVVFTMTISDPAAYTDAFTDLIDSSQNPGSVRLMELRFGGEGATHAALISATDFVAANKYLDELLSSSAYRSFSRKVGDIRDIKTVSYYRRIKSWGY
jgi:hypothetical protein